MLDVLMLTGTDLANMEWRFYNCLKMLDLNVRAFKAAKHMKYGNEIETIPMSIRSKVPLIFRCEKLLDLATEAKVLHFTSGTFVDTGIDIQQKKVVFQYGGRPFVGRPAVRNKCTKFINNFVTYTIVHHPYLLNLGAKHDCFIKPPVDTVELQPDFERKNLDKVIIGHFPSNESRKGTAVIRGVLEYLKKTSFENKFDYLIETERVPWADQLLRIKKCDIIIECLTPVVVEDTFGEWSTATLEAASLGKIVITNSFNEDIYEQHYGKSEICIANNEKQLRRMLIRLLKKPVDELQQKKLATREWVVKCHSMEATTKMLWEKVYKNLFPDRRPKLIYGENLDV